MSITDELREWAVNHRAELDMGKLYPAMIEQIADRIDERYHKDMATAQKVGYNDGEDAAMRDGWVRLPVDADGVPIHIGDKVSEPDYRPEGGVVVGIKLFQGWDHWLINCGAWVNPRNCRHVQPDSWERIIQDAIAEGFERTDVSAPCEVGNDELVERCRRVARS